MFVRACVRACMHIGIEDRWTKKDEDAVGHVAQDREHPDGQGLVQLVAREQLDVKLVVLSSSEGWDRESGRE